MEMELGDIINELYAIKCDMIRDGHTVPLSFNQLLVKLNIQYDYEQGFRNDDLLTLNA